MINLYFEAKKIIMPDNDIPKPNEILDNKRYIVKNLNIILIMLIQKKI